MSFPPPTFVAGFHDEEAVRKMKYGKLGKTDMSVSRIALGGAPFGDMYGPIAFDTAKAIVITALRSGINVVDTAPRYGEGTSEQVLGKILKEVPRQAYYLSTKVGRYGEYPDSMDYSGDNIIAEFENSLKRLGVDYVDILHIHDMEFAPSEDLLLTETLPAMQRLKDAGKVKYISISGYPLDVLKSLLFSSSCRSIIDKTKVTIDCLITYARATLFDSSLEDLSMYFKSKQLGVINASPTGLGLLTNQGPQPWHKASDALKAKSKEAAEYCQENDVNITKLAHFYAFNFPGVHTTLIGVNTVEMLLENIAVSYPDFKLTAKEQECLNTIKYRYFGGKARNHWEGAEHASHAAYMTAKYGGAENGSL